MYNWTTGKVKEGFDESNCSTIGEAIKPYVAYLDWFVENFFDLFFIQYPTNSINWIIDTICKMGGSKDSNDNTIVGNNIRYFIAIFVSFFVVYNWYYLMFAKLIVARVDTLKISSDELIYYNYKIGQYFKYLVEPVAFVNNVLLVHVPHFIGMFRNSKLRFIALLLIIIYYINYFKNDFIVSFSNYLKRQSDAYSPYLIAAIVIFGFINDVSRFIVHIPISSILLMILWFIFLLTISIMMQWFAGLLAMGHILGLSFFGIQIYSPYGLFTTIKTIISKLRSHKHFEETDPGDPSQNKGASQTEMCQDEKAESTESIGFFEALTSIELLYQWLLNNVFNHIYEIVLIFALFGSMTDYSLNIKTPNLKQLLLILNGILVFIIGIIVVIRHYAIDIADREQQKMENEANRKFGTERCEESIDHKPSKFNIRISKLMRNIVSDPSDLRAWYNYFRGKAEAFVKSSH